MLSDRVLSDILLSNNLVAEKDLRNAMERQKNIEAETLEESLMFLGVANYALLGKAYELHYKIPYYPVFHQGPDKDMLLSFSPKAARRFSALPVKKESSSIHMVTCQPEDAAMLREMDRIWKSSTIQWQVASQVEVLDAVQKYCFHREITREKRGIELPFDFKIIDFQVESGKQDKLQDDDAAVVESSKGRRIILVEPDHKIRNALKTLLLLEGYRVKAVVDEGEAVKELEREEAMYLLKRRTFQTSSQRFESFKQKNGKPLEIRHYGTLGGILLGTELSSEQIFRTYLSTVKLLLARMTWNKREIKESCDQLSHYARLMATSIGMNRKSQEALQLAIYLKEIGRYLPGISEHDDVFSIMPVLPYEQSSLMLREIEDNFSLAEIIAGINQPSTAELPLASKIITLLLTYFEILNDQGVEYLEPNQLRNLLLGRNDSGLLDEELVSQLVQIVAHEQRLSGLGGNRGVILILDPVFERDHGDLYQQLSRENYDIIFAVNVEQAQACLRQQEVSLVVSEMVGDEYDGLDFCRLMHHVHAESTENHQVPFVFFTSITDEKMISEALLVGADDVIAKDSSTQVAFLKFGRLIKQYQASRTNNRGAAGVSGSLDEMGFMETVQILVNRGKDALIKLKNDAGKTANVYLHDGEIIFAATETLDGEEAIYELLTWKGGFFQVMTPDQLPDRNVFGSTEAIMLEGCRLMDEESRESFG